MVTSKVITSRYVDNSFGHEILAEVTTSTGNQFFIGWGFPVGKFESLGELLSSAEYSFDQFITRDEALKAFNSADSLSALCEG